MQCRTYQSLQPRVATPYTRHAQTSLCRREIVHYAPELRDFRDCRASCIPQNSRKSHSAHRASTSPFLKSPVEGLFTLHPRGLRILSRVLGHAEHVGDSIMDVFHVRDEHNLLERCLELPKGLQNPLAPLGIL